MDISEIHEDAKKAAIVILKNFRPLFSNPVTEEEMRIVIDVYDWIAEKTSDDSALMDDFYEFYSILDGLPCEVDFAIGWLQTMENEHKERGLIQTDPWESCV